ncbi:hypothetical protein EI94DRAFT_497452 [Lactarius quietus]|nr:hypothetical protein EI94DRAFT_497452 [Lactarius quietus]
MPCSRHPRLCVFLCYFPNFQAMQNIELRVYRSLFWSYIAPMTIYTIRQCYQTKSYPKIICPLHPVCVMATIYSLDSEVPFSLKRTAVLASIDVVIWSFSFLEFEGMLQALQLVNALHARCIKHDDRPCGIASIPITASSSSSASSHRET